LGRTAPHPTAVDAPDLESVSKAEAARVAIGVCAALVRVATGVGRLAS
jgi:hypothetical protein